MSWLQGCSNFPLLCERLLDIRATRYGREPSFVLSHSSRENVNLKDADGCAPLHLTADVGKLDAVRLLLAFGADIDAGTKIKEPII